MGDFLVSNINEMLEHDAPIVFKAPPEEKPAEQPQPHEVAALKPRASQFGATELVQEEPEFTPGIYDRLIPETLGKDQADNEKTEKTSQEETKDFDAQSKQQEENDKEITSEGSDVLFKPVVKTPPVIKPSTRTQQGQQQKASQRTNVGTQAKIASPMEKKLTFNMI